MTFDRKEFENSSAVVFHSRDVDDWDLPLKSLRYEYNTFFVCLFVPSLFSCHKKATWRYVLDESALA